MDHTECSDDLLGRIYRLLLQQGYPHHRRLQIRLEQNSAEKNVVRVEGQVPSFYLRQVALECIKRVPGVERIIDCMQVGACADPFDSPDATLETSEKGSASEKGSGINSQMARRVLRTIGS